MYKLIQSWDNTINSYPFKYFYTYSGLSNEICNDILDWLETTAPWKRVNTYFYDQYEFHLEDAQIPTNLKFLTSHSFLTSLRDYIESNFQSSHLSEKVDIVAHKLIGGDTIGIHNDYIEGCETHRILFNFNRGWSEEQGGFFMVFSDDNPEAIHDVIMPQNGYVHGFEITSNSHHAVSKIYAGERFSIIYSFYKERK